MRNESSFIRPISSSVGGCTLRRMSALLKTSSSRRAPFLSYSTSKNPADSPAPDWTVTSKLALVSLGTSSGTRATRRSFGTVSFGTLTIIGICESVEALLARYCSPVCPSGYFQWEPCPPAVPNRICRICSKGRVGGGFLLVRRIQGRNRTARQNFGDSQICRCRVKTGVRDVKCRLLGSRKCRLATAFTLNSR